MVENARFMEAEKIALFFSLNIIMSNFKEICTVPTDFGVTFTKFKSDKTGLTVMLADIEGKLYNSWHTL